MPEPTERRGAERYKWTARAEGIGPEHLPLRLTLAPNADICDISATGILVRGLGSPPQSLELAIEKPGTSGATVQLALKEQRSDRFVFETHSAQRALVDDALVYFMQEGWLTRSEQSPAVHAGTAADDCFLGRGCPVVPDCCQKCGASVPQTYSIHCECGHPRMPPNLLAACAATERKALRATFLEKTKSLSPAQVSEARALLRDSFAVLACKPKLLLSILWGITKLPNYHAEVARGFRLPDGPEWAFLRGVIDQALFGDYKGDIRFAALSLDGRGVRRFGDCFVQLKSSAVQAKANVFIENSFYFLQDLPLRNLRSGLEGKRAAWPHRDYLVMAKLEEAFREPFSCDSVAASLIEDGIDPQDDKFVEVQVYGPLGVEAFSCVSIPESEPERDAIERECRKHSIRFMTRPS